MRQLGLLLRWSARQTYRQPLAAILAITITCVGIASASIVALILFVEFQETLPVRDPHTLLLLEKRRPSPLKPTFNFTYSEVDALESRHDLFKGIAAEQDPSRWKEVVIQSQQTSKKVVTVDLVSDNYYSLLGLPALVGRVPTAREAHSGDVEGVLSYSFWKSYYRGRRSAIGSVIRTARFSIVVSGVLPKAFHSVVPDAEPDIRIAAAATPVVLGYAAKDSQVYGGPDYLVFARVTRNMPLGFVAQAAARDLNKAVESEWLAWNSSQKPPMSIDAVNATIRMQSNSGLLVTEGARGISFSRERLLPIVKVLTIATGFLLLVVVLNVSGFISTLMLQQDRERAICISLGVSRRLLATQSSLQAWILVGPSFVASWGATCLCLTLAWNLLLNRNRNAPSATTPLVAHVPLTESLVISLGCSLALAILIGGIASLRSLVSAPQTALRSTSIGGQKMQLVLVAFQIACAVMLIDTGYSALMTLVSLRTANLGFQAARVLETKIDFSQTSQIQRSRVAAMLAAQLSQSTSTTAYGFAQEGLLTGAELAIQLKLNSGADIVSKVVRENNVTKGLFASLGVPLLQGAVYQNGTQQRPTPVLINKEVLHTFPERHLAVGDYISSGSGPSVSRDFQIVGIVGDSRYGSINDPAPPTVYLPLDLSDLPEHVTLYVRYRGSVAGEEADIKRAIDSAADDTLQWSTEQMSQVVDLATRPQLTAAAVAVGVSVISLCVAILGLYNVMTQCIQLRAREISLRIALGATKGQIATSIFGTTGKYVAAGIMVGGTLSVVSQRVVLHEVRGVLHGGLEGVTASVMIVLLSVGFSGWRQTLRAYALECAALLRDE